MGFNFSKQSRIRFWRAGKIAAGVLGLVFIAAGVAKGINLTEAVRQIKGYGIISDNSLLVILTWCLAAFECALGAALVINFRPQKTLLAALGLLLVFFGALFWAWITGVIVDCGCFGKWVTRTPGQALVEDFLFLALWLAAWLCRGQESDRQKSRNRTAVVLVMGVAGLLLPLFFGFSVQNALPTQPGQGMVVPPVKIISGKPVNWNQGAYLIELMDTDCEHCIDAVFDLNALAKNPDMPQIISLCVSPRQDVAMFVEMFAPEYPVLRVAENDFWRLVDTGDVPRFLLVRDGRVAFFWEQKAPETNDILVQMMTKQIQAESGWGMEFLSIIPGLIALYFVWLCLNMKNTRQPCFISGRRFFMLIALPVVIIMDIALWKVLVVPSYVGQNAFFTVMLVVFCACAIVLWQRGNWHYIFGVGQDDMILSIKNALVEKNIQFDENFSKPCKESDNTCIIKLNAKKSDLRVAVYSGQSLAQVGVVPGDSALLKSIIPAIKKQLAAQNRDKKKTAPGFLLVICALMVMATYVTYTHIHDIDADWLAEKGRTYLETKRPDAALASFDKAIAADPQNMEALRWRGVAFQKARKDSKALADWQKALEINPSDSDIMAHMAQLFASSDQNKIRNPKKALEMAEHAVNLAPDSVFCLDTLAFVLAQTKNFEQAAKIQARVVDILKQKHASKDLMNKVNARLDAYRANQMGPPN